MELFIHTLWWTVLNLGPAWPLDFCADKTWTNIFIKPAKGYERMIQRFREDLATSGKLFKIHGGYM